MSYRLALYVCLALLVVDAVLELSFIAATVGWLAGTASGTFAVVVGGSSSTEVVHLRGEPERLLVDQGHSSNGAAGTAIVLVGLGGILALWLRSRAGFNASPSSRAIYSSWVAINVLALLLTIGSLGYVFSVTNTHKGQSIDTNRLVDLDGDKYPYQTWTPQGWFSAVLNLDLEDGGVANDIRSHLRIMRGWQYNLIPMFLIQLAETALVLLDAWSYYKSSTTAPTGQKDMGSRPGSDNETKASPV